MILYDFSSEVKEYIDLAHDSVTIIPEDKLHSAFKHTTFLAHSLSEYIDIVDLIHKSQEKDNCDLAFRGVSNYAYRLEPSLKILQDKPYVLDRTDDKLECCLVNDFLTTRPEEFSNIESDFDLLAKMQHLGLPTRLLDFSLNPLVALYFACQSMSKNTARVICTYDTSSINSRNFVEKVCGIYKIPEFTNYFLEYMGNTDTSIIQYLHGMMEPLMAHPKHINERIKRQSGIFMIFQNKVYDEAWFNIANREEDDYTCVYSSKDGIEKLSRIKSAENPYEIFEIEKGESLLYRQFEVDTNSFYKMRNYYKEFGDFTVSTGNALHINDNIKWAFLKRFELSYEIASMSEEVMSKNFCSILIPPECKQRIIKELNIININEAFLFPEPEYTAKHIKKKYQY